jgi:hypothetical protein
LPKYLLGRAAGDASLPWDGATMIVVHHGCPGFNAVIRHYVSFNCATIAATKLIWINILVIAKFLGNKLDPGQSALGGCC